MTRMMKRKASCHGKKVLEKKVLEVWRPWSRMPCYKTVGKGVVEMESED